MNRKRPDNLAPHGETAPKVPLFPTDDDAALFPDSTVSDTDLTGLMPTPVSVPGAQALTGLMTMPCPLCATPEVPAHPLPPDESAHLSDAHN